MTVDRIRKVNTLEEMEDLVDEKVTLGYTVKSKGTNSVLMKKKDYGSLGAHLLIALVTAWWTFFLGNVAYLLYKYITADEIEIKLRK